MLLEKQASKQGTRLNPDALVTLKTGPGWSTASFQVLSAEPLHVYRPMETLCISSLCAFWANFLAQGEMSFLPFFARHSVTYSLSSISGRHLSRWDESPAIL